LIRGDEWFVIRQMHREGLSISEISRRTGHDRKTVRKMIASGSQPVYRPRSATTSSKLDPHRAYVLQRMKVGVNNAVKMLRELRARGYDGGITILKEFMRPHRSREKAVARYETPPGYQAQVDWGTCGRIHEGGVLKTVYCFCMTLGHSRGMYVEFTTRCDTRAFIRGHVNAFSFFGGVTETCLYDNLKSVRLAMTKDGAKLNPTFVDFADTFGFVPKLCRPRRPQTKGKVESGIAYVKGNFLPGESFSSLAEMNGAALGWLNGVANVRVHGTTGEVPVERLVNERLAPLRPSMVFDTALYQTRKITRDCLISYQGCRYSVPHKFAGRECLVRDNENGIFDIMVDGTVVTTHRRSEVRGKTIIVSRHYSGIKTSDTPAKATLPLLSVISAPQVEVRSLEVYQQLAGDRL